MSTLSRAISGARPPLSKVAPLTYSICWGYVLVNIVLGLGMVFLFKVASPPLAVANIFSYRVWGILFLIVASATGLGLVRNNWDITKRSQLMGIGLKSIWAIALIIRCFIAPNTILITGVWAFFTYIQIVLYVHFIPYPIEALQTKGLIHD